MSQCTCSKLAELQIVNNPEKATTGLANWRFGHGLGSLSVCAKQTEGVCTTRMKPAVAVLAVFDNLGLALNFRNMLLVVFVQLCLPVEIIAGQLPKFRSTQVVLP